MPPAGLIMIDTTCIRSHFGSSTFLAHLSSSLAQHHAGSTDVRRAHADHVAASHLRRADADHVAASHSQVVHRHVHVPGPVQIVEQIRHVHVPQIQEQIVEIHVPQIQHVEKIVEVPQIQTVEKIVHIPVHQTHEVIKHVPIIQLAPEVTQAPPTVHHRQDVHVPVGCFGPSGVTHKKAEQLDWHPGAWQPAGTTRRLQRRRDRIFGKHLQEHMEMLQEEDPTKYEAHFARFIADGTEPDGIEEMYSSAHSKIREDPVHKPAEKKGTTYKRVGNQVHGQRKSSHSFDALQKLRPRVLRLTLLEPVRSYAPAALWFWHRSC